MYPICTPIYTGGSVTTAGFASAVLIHQMSVSSEFETAHSTTSTARELKAICSVLHNIERSSRWRWDIFCGSRHALLLPVLCRGPQELYGVKKEYCITVLPRWVMTLTSSGLPVFAPMSATKAWTLCSAIPAYHRAVTLHIHKLPAAAISVTTCIQTLLQENVGEACCACNRADSFWMSETVLTATCLLRVRKVKKMSSLKCVVSLYLFIYVRVTETR